MIEPLVVWGALAAVSAFLAALIKRYLDHLESDVTYGRQTSERGVETSERAASELDRGAD